MPAWGFIDNCAGSETAAFFGAGLLTSYLFLFIDFYIRTYRKAPTGSRSKRANGNGVVANGNGNGIKKE